MTITITPRTILAFIGVTAIMAFAGYGAGNLGAKAFFFLTSDASSGGLLF